LFQGVGTTRIPNSSMAGSSRLEELQPDAIA
jgi:hypothetical protein